MTRFLIITAALILIVPATAHAVAIHVHEKVPVEHSALVGKDVDTGEPVLHEWTTMREVVRVEHVAPVDEDADGVADAEDSCVFCQPDPVPAESSPSYSAPATSAMPSMVACESGGDPNVYDSSGTYWGLGQFDQSTWDAYAPSGEWGSASAEEQIAAINAVPYDAWPNC